MSFKLPILFISLLLITNAFAQNGKISGKVTDNAGTMIGVIIQINDSAAVTTDIEGRYTFNNVRPGVYRVKATMLGYKTKVIKGIKVTADHTSTINFFMEEEGNELEGVEIVVDASNLKKDNDALTTLDIKNSAVMGSATSAESIRRSPDRVVSDVMKRISGASVQDNKFVIIRGLADRYNTALINGMPLPSTEPDKKAFSFDIFPAVMLDNMTIYKTAAPDLPGDFAGGVIQLATRDIPDSNSLSISFGLSYNSQSTFKQYLSYEGGKKDWMGFDDGTRQLPDSILEPDSMKAKLLNPYTRYRYSKMLPNDWRIDTLEKSPLGQSYQMAFANHFNLFKNDFGIVGALTYNYNRRMQDIYRADFDTDTLKLYEYTDKQYKESVHWGGMLNLAYKLDSINTKISWKNMISVTGQDIVTERSGTDITLDRYVRATGMEYNSSILFSSQLTGDHVFGKKGKRDKTKARWGVGYSEISRDIPDLRRMYYIKNRTPQDTKADSLWEAYVPFGAPSPNYAGKFWSDLTEVLWSGTADVTVPFKIYKGKPGEKNSKPGQKNNFKVGAAAQIKDREFDARVFGYSVANFSQFNYDLLYLDQAQIFDTEHIGNNQGFKLGEATAPSDDYLAGSELYAGYLMFDQQFTFGRDATDSTRGTERILRAVYGARIESFHQKLDAQNYSGDTIAVDTTYIDVLPSLNLTYSLNEKTNIRLAGSRTLARAEFREIAPFSFYDFNSSTAVIGNDTLTRTNITNADIKFEHYPGAGQMFAVTAFYKDFKNPIESVAFYGGSGSRTRSFQNAKQATNYGAELEYRTKLNFIDSIGLRWKQWDSFTFFTNLAYIHSSVDLSDLRFSSPDIKERPLQGQSPYIINCGLNYLNDSTGTGFSLLFNKIGRRISDVGSDGYLDIYEAPRSIIDFQVSQKFLKEGEIKVNVSDILNREAIFYQDENGSGKFEETGDKKITGIKLGYNISFSVSYKF
jgi:outer membrane receptor protein involved in Fe transport